MSDSGTAPRRLPILIWEVVKLAWSAGRRELLVVTGTSLVSTAGMLGELLLGRALLRGLLLAHAGHGDVSTLLPLIIGMTTLSTALGLASAVGMNAQRTLSSLTTRQAQNGILEVADRVELAAFDSPDFHDALARASMGIPRLGMLISMLANLIRSLAGILAAVVALTILDPPLIAFAAVVCLPLFLTASRRNRLMYAFQMQMTPSERERTYLFSTMTARHTAQELRAYQLSPYLRARYDRLYDHYIDELRAVGRRMLRIAGGADLAAGVLLTGGIALIIALSLKTHVGLASGAMSAIAVFALGQRLLSTNISASNLVQSAFFVEDYMRVREWQAPPAKRTQAGRPLPGSPRVVVEDLHFAYPSSQRPVLRGISLTIEPGEVVALVGSNGSGKTTLAKLLAGLYRPSAGSVRWNGVELDEAHPDQVRGNVALIFQDFLRYALPARDNILAGRHERASDEWGIRRAAAAAGAEGFIEALSDGFATRLGPEHFGGTEISLGQWQRIALARVLFRDAPFVILDEPTASLDAQAEHALFTDMRKLFPGRTVLLISHRFATVREADRIFVMQDGLILEQGDHHELLAAGELYAEMFNLQAGAYL